MSDRPSKAKTALLLMPKAKYTPSLVVRFAISHSTFSTNATFAHIRTGYLCVPALLWQLHHKFFWQIDSSNANTSFSYFKTSFLDIAALNDIRFGSLSDSESERGNVHMYCVLQRIFGRISHIAGAIYICVWLPIQSSRSLAVVSTLAKRSEDERTSGPCTIKRA